MLGEINMQYTNSKGKIVGNEKDGIYRRRAKSSKHLLRVMDAWGIDKSILENLTERGATEIRILDEDKNEVYSVTVAKFNELGVERDFEGPQVFLPRKYWEVTNHKG